MNNQAQCQADDTNCESKKSEKLKLLILICDEKKEN